MGTRRDFLRREAAYSVVGPTPVCQNEGEPRAAVSHQKPAVERGSGQIAVGEVPAQAEEGDSEKPPQDAEPSEEEAPPAVAAIAARNVLSAPQFALPALLGNGNEGDSICFDHDTSPMRRSP